MAGGVFYGWSEGYFIGNFFNILLFFFEASRFGWVFFFDDELFVVNGDFFDQAVSDDVVKSGEVFLEIEEFGKISRYLSE